MTPEEIAKIITKGNYKISNLKLDDEFSWADVVHEVKKEEIRKTAKTLFWCVIILSLLYIVVVLIV